MSHLPVRYSPALVMGPTAKPVTLEEAKAYCRNDPADDAIVSGLIDAAVEVLDGPEGELRRCLMPQTWTQPFEGFHVGLPLPFPALSIDEVTYLDADGALQILDPASYRLEDPVGLPRVVRVNDLDWPATLAASRATVFVRFVAGFEKLPEPLKRAILLDIRRSYGALKAGSDLKKEVVEGVGSREWDFSGSLDAKIGAIIDRDLSRYRRVDF